MPWYRVELTPNSMDPYLQLSDEAQEKVITSLLKLTDSVNNTVLVDTAEVGNLRLALRFDHKERVVWITRILEVAKS